MTRTSSRYLLDMLAEVPEIGSQSTFYALSPKPVNPDLQRRSVLFFSTF